MFENYTYQTKHEKNIQRTWEYVNDRAILPVVNGLVMLLTTFDCVVIKNLSTEMYISVSGRQRSHEEMKAVSILESLKYSSFIRANVKTKKTNRMTVEGEYSFYGGAEL